jgi:hypothetical protein
MGQRVHQMGRSKPTNEALRTAGSIDNAFGTSKLHGMTL